MSPPPSPGDPPRSLFTACRRICLPDPYPPGVVCVFVVDTPEGPWLVDAGPPGDRPANVLRIGLSSCRLEVADLRGVLLTHAHLDHVGGLRDWRPPRVVAHREALDSLRASAETDPGSEADERLRRAGVPPSRLEDLRGYREPLDPELGRSLGVDRRLEGDEGELPWGGGWRWIRVRGHAPGHLLLQAPVGGHLLVGDQFMAKLKTPYDLSDPDGDPVGDYLESVERTAALGGSALHSSHTETIRPASEWLGRRRREIRRQVDRVTGALEPGDTARDVAGRVYPGDREPGRQALLLREVLSQLRRAAATGRARRRCVEDEGAVVERFDPAD